MRGLYKEKNELYTLVVLEYYSSWVLGQENDVTLF